MEKEGKNLSSFIFSRCIQNSKTLALIGAEKSVTEILIGEKEKLTNKRNEKQGEADSLLHNTNVTSCPTFVPNFKILGKVVPEKSLREKKVYIYKNTHNYRKDKKYSRE